MAKYCEHCGKRIQNFDFIQVTFFGKLQQHPLKLKQTFQFEFCSISCFQEYFKFFMKEEFENELYQQGWIQNNKPS